MDQKNNTISRDNANARLKEFCNRFTRMRKDFPEIHFYGSAVIVYDDGGHPAAAGAEIYIGSGFQLMETLAIMLNRRPELQTVLLMNMAVLKQDADPGITHEEIFIPR